jgi:Cthe_2314-like HEPN
MQFQDSAPYYKVNETYARFFNTLRRADKEEDQILGLNKLVERIRFCIEKEQIIPYIKSRKNREEILILPDIMKDLKDNRITCVANFTELAEMFQTKPEPITKDNKSVRAISITRQNLTSSCLLTYQISYIGSRKFGYKVIISRKTNVIVCSHYSEIESDIVKKLLDDRIEFKLWAAQRHLDKLEKIETSYGGIMGKNRVYAEDELDCYFAQIIGAKDSLLMSINKRLELNIQEDKVTLYTVNKELEKRNNQDVLYDLNKLDCDKSSWYSGLGKVRNRSIHISTLRKQAKVNVGVNPSTVKNYLLLPPDYNSPMDKETIVFLSENIVNMKRLIDTITEKVDHIDRSR